ncbi:MAG: LysM peptidoglycan-binding domain-containing protein [Syntrophobacterales bacterium]|jgi:N-acetylmuramoyl-L-alanine amidase|nr:LysM peptidoglycan-binding domain-containing protein [Syntrophobacterales bacterium]
MKKRIIYILFLGSIFACLFAGHVFAQGSMMMNMRHFTAPDNTRVVFDLTEPPLYETTRQNNILTILLKGTTCAESIPRETRLRKSGIETITITPLAEGDIRIQIKMRSNTDVQANVFDLKPFQNRPDRLVIDVELPEVSRQESRLREQTKVAKKKKVIILDPGHGGDDPGAVGGRGTYEKDIVLDISRRTKKLLDSHGLFQTYLTRDGDYYLTFDKRLRIAREYGADMFISIHTDAARNREAKGSSVYSLSTGEASSVAAKLLAQSENLADIAGGSQKAADAKNPVLLKTTNPSSPILLNMYQTNTINLSKDFGATVLDQLEEVGELKFKKVQEAPFLVLKMPEIPSVLVETAYISNAGDEKKLRDPVFREKLAAAIARAVVKFFSSLPPDFGQDGEEERFFLSYTVEKGDTLSNIAARFGLPLQTLLRDNDLNVNAPLHVGRKLKIETKGLPAEGKSVSEPVTGKPPETPQKNTGANTTPRYYVVEKGDTLTKIGERFGVTVQDLLAENKLRKDDPLYVGKRLKIISGQTRGNIHEDRPSGKAKTTKPAVPESIKEKKILYYIVVKGDTLTKIAERFGVTVQSILDSNGMKIKDPLYAGRRLKIEKEELVVKNTSNSGNPRQISGKSGEKQKIVYKTYQVKKGDNLSNIARKHGVSIASLLKLNNMKQGDPLHVGRILQIGPPETAGKARK